MVLLDIFKFMLLFTTLAILPACYHIRVEAVAIADRTVTLKEQPQYALKKIRRLFEDNWKLRVLSTEKDGMTLITAPYDFATDTSPGQPPGGRKYSTQLRIEIQTENEIRMLHLTHYNLEIRTSYTYSEGGRLGTLIKHYPYQKYPGMFELDLINQEMDRAKLAVERIFKEHK